jgi:hypothetical protein
MKYITAFFFFFFLIIKIWINLRLKNMSYCLASEKKIIYLIIYWTRFKFLKHTFNYLSFIHRKTKTYKKLLKFYRNGKNLHKSIDPIPSCWYEIYFLTYILLLCILLLRNKNLNSAYYPIVNHIYLLS